MDNKKFTIIESIGTYLPPKSLSSTEVLHGCKNIIQFPFENITGIKTRRTAGETEFSIDLAINAVEDCLANSKYNQSEIDLLICCNISRWDGPDAISFEPCTSITLKKHFGFTHALVFDITNACAGMFTGIHILNAFINTGASRRGMIVSGEYITHLTKTAQKEIESFMDSRLACLTLGDAAAAVIVEKATEPETGFIEFELQTYGKYSPYCIVKPSTSGGFIMYTDSVNLTDVAIKSGASHSINTLTRANWPPDSFQHLIMHQTSKMTLNSASREINRLLKNRISSDENTINNLEHRGNTASTSHFIAIADKIRNKKINAGDKIVFSISASGLTIGTALYIFDDLPDRLSRKKSKKDNSIDINHAHFGSWISNPVDVRIQIESVGTVPIDSYNSMNSIETLKHAVINCLDNSSYTRNDIDLLIYSGVYRSEYMMEPAIAALLAGELDMNASITSTNEKKTLAFDIFNGSVGFLNACYTAQQMISAKTCNAAMIVAAECENNLGKQSNMLMGIRETGSALILNTSPSGNKGFSRFLFSYDLQSQNAYTTYYIPDKDNPHLNIEKNANLDELYINCILPAVKELLLAEGLDFDKINIVFPPQISSAFILQLSKQLNIPVEKCVDVVGVGPDLFTSSLPYAFNYADKKQLVKPDDKALVICVGSGLQVGCAIYHF